MVSQPAPLAIADVSLEWSQNWAMMGAPFPLPWPGVDDEPASGGEVHWVGGLVGLLPLLLICVIAVPSQAVFV